MSSAITFEIHAGLAGLDTLREDWTALQRACSRSDFHTDWRWHHAVARHLGIAPLYYVALRREGVLEGVVPLQHRPLRRGPAAIPSLSFPAHDHINLADMLIRSPADLPALFPRLVEFLGGKAGLPWHCLRFRGVAEGANMLAAIGSGLVDIEPYGANAFFDTRDDADRPLPKKQLRNVARLRAKAEAEIGTVRSATSSTPGDLAQAFQSFLAVEASGWKGHSATAIASDPALTAFYRALLELFGADGCAAINLLWFGERVAAAQFCLDHGRVRSILKIGYEDDFRAYGPGSILLGDVLHQARQDPKIDEVNLVTAPDWAERWHPETRTVYRIIGFRHSVLGWVLRAADGVRRDRGGEDG